MPSSGHHRAVVVNEGGFHLGSTKVNGESEGARHSRSNQERACGTAPGYPPEGRGSAGGSGSLIRERKGWLGGVRGISWGKARAEGVARQGLLNPVSHRSSAHVSMKTANVVLPDVRAYGSYRRGADMDWSDELLSLRAPELYYKNNKTRGEIGAELHIPRWKVGRLLEQARQRGVVRIEILHPRARRLVLERRLREATALRDAVVVS